MKTALITGANKGIGFETARQLANVGFKVFLTARSTERGQAAADSLASKKLDVEFLPLDVADPASIQRAAQDLSNRIDHLDLLINNAGIYDDGGNSILDTDEDLFLRTMRTNTLGALQVAQQLWPLVAKSNDGRIINLSSGLSQLEDMDGDAPAYSISKTALNAVTRQLAHALGPHGIAVNALCPGWVKTEMGGDGATRSVEDGARSVLWLALDAPSTLTGQLVRDGKTVHW